MNYLNKLLHNLAPILCLLMSAVAYANPAGHVQFVNGEVQQTTSAGQVYTLHKGDVVSEGDTLVTAKNASAQIKMLDGGFIAIRSDTKLKLDRFKFDEREDGTERSFFSLLKGGLRAITGLIGRVNKSSYRITTPTSTIGIRGTDHETVVVVPDSELAETVPSGTYNKVNTGETSMTTEKGTVFVLPNQMGFSGASNELPTLQPVNANLFDVVKNTTPSKPQADKKNGKPSQPASKQASKPAGQKVRANAVVDIIAREKTAKNKVVVTTNNAPKAGKKGMVVNSLSNNPEKLAPLALVGLPIATTNGANLSGGVKQLPGVGFGGIAYFSSHSSQNCVFGCVSAVSNLWSGGLGDKIEYASDLGGLNAFKASGLGISGTRGTAIVVNEGSVTLAGGVETINWGRWTGSGAKLNFPAATSIPVFNLHYVGGSPVSSMPVTGVANYIPVGGTSPTDSLGKVGQFTGATVQANFTAAQISVGINLSFNGVAYTTSGSGNFSANGVIPATSMTVSCVPQCISTAQGHYVGAFTGTNASGLGLVYHVNDSNRTVDIVGAQAFVRK